MNILKNDVNAILSKKVNSISTRNGKSSTFPPGPYKQCEVCDLSSRGLTLPCEFSVLFIHKSEVISLKTSGKRLPGKKLAIYVGVVLAVLVLAYNLTKDLSFILVCDKEGDFNKTVSLQFEFS